MAYFSVVIILCWFAYSWNIGVALIAICGFSALFYGAILEGLAQEKIVKAFSWIVVAASISMVGVIFSETATLDADAPRMCSRFEC